MSNITISALTTGANPVTISVSEGSTSLSTYLGDNRGLAVSIPYGGTGINLTSMGRFPDPTNSVWRLRNGTTALVSSSLSAYGGGFSGGYDLPSNSDTFVVSPIFTTHILNYSSGSKVKAAGSQTFTYGYDISPNNTSNTNYTLVGGGGDDIITGTSKEDILVGKLGNDTLFLGSDMAADTVSYKFGDGSDIIYGFVKDETLLQKRDLLSFTGTSDFNIDVVVRDSISNPDLQNTELRLHNGGDLLATIVGVTGLTEANLASTNTATFVFIS